MKLSNFNELLARLDGDLDLINEKYGLFSTEIREKLLRDIHYLFLDNIAKEIRFVFYDPENKSCIFREYCYCRDGTVDQIDRAGEFEHNSSAGIAFDLFVDFTEPFLRLPGRDQQIMLTNTEFDWYSYG